MKKSSIGIIIGVAIAVIVIVSILIFGGNNPSTPEHTHSYGEWQVIKEATCTEAGVKERYCDCGEKQTQNTSATGHSYGEWQVTKDATCTEGGIKERYCECGDNQSQNISSTGHEYVWTTTKEATCLQQGEKVGVCSNCNDEKSEIIPLTNVHSYNNGTVTQQPTCTQKGIKTFTCTVCNTTKQEYVSSLGHSVDNSGKCTRCGLMTLNMTSKEIDDSKKVKTMTHSVAEFSSYINLNITLKDENGYSLQVPVYVNIRIVDDEGNVLYNETIIKKSSQTSVKIQHSDLKPGTSETGTFYYKVYNDYVTFDELSRELTDLPWTVDVELPTLPDVIWDNGYNSSGCKITDITYEVSGSTLYIYFTGEKVYDEKGDGYSQSCKIGWKLYDSDGYVVDDGTCYTSSIKVGEKFKDAKAIASGVIQKGESYTLVILDLG